MILAIDIGNTSINFGIFDGNELMLRYSLPSSERTTPAKCLKRLQGFLTSTRAAVTGAATMFARENLNVRCIRYLYSW